MHRLCLATALVIITALGAGAASLVPPSDLGELARTADLVALARAESSRVERSGSLPRTVTRFHLVERVSGSNVSGTFEVAEVGGTIDGVGFAAPGIPVYRAGATYLLFLSRRPDGRWGSTLLAYGLLELDVDRDLLEPLPEAADLGLVAAEGITPVVRYRASALLAHLREVALGLPFRQDRVAAPAALLPSLPAAGPPSCRQLTSSGDGHPVRWFDFELGTNSATMWGTTPGQSGLADGGQGAVAAAIGAWGGFGHGVIHFVHQGVRPRSITCTGGSDHSVNEVVFDDPCNDIVDMTGCSGVLAFGGTWFSSATRSYDGTPWHPAFSPFVVVNNGAGCIGETNFAEMLTHELGHSMGFGHHTDSNATMYGMCCHYPRGAGLAATDEVCASFQYHTFLDVPYAHWAWRFVEAVDNAGVTSGCAAGLYCPAATVTRQQMAVFLLKAKYGSGYTPPACTVPTFSDVPCSSPFAAWIEDLVAKGITAGCGVDTYCPSAPVTREQMAVFLLKTEEGSGYVPPACTAPTFIDVPCSSPFAPWIEELVSRAITAGCGGSSYCPTAVSPRDQMAVFLTRTFTLPQP